MVWTSIILNKAVLVQLIHFLMDSVPDCDFHALSAEAGKDHRARHLLLVDRQMRWIRRN